MASLYELTLAYTYANQQCINRWNYVESGAPAAVSRSFGLVAAFGAVYDEVHVPPQYPPDTPLGKIAALVSVGVVFQQLTALAVYDPTDFYQTPFSPAYGGSNDGLATSPMLAYGFRSTQVRRDVARGTKRFAGVCEENMGDDGIVNVGATHDLLAAIATAMTDVLTYDDEGNTLSYTPAVCHKEEYDPNPPPLTGNHRAYRYYPTEAEQLEHTAQGIIWQPYDYVRSQVSRQYGHGR